MALMAASDHLQPEQLRMFMTGNEVMNYATPGDFPQPGQQAAGWDRKLTRAKTLESPSLYESIQAQGVQEPVNITHRGSGPVLTEGHHRVAAAADLGQYVPVVHDTGQTQSFTPQQTLPPQPAVDTSKWNEAGM